MEETERAKALATLIEPTIQFLDHIEKTHQFYHLAVDGITLLRQSFEREEELTAELEKLDTQASIQHDHAHKKSSHEYYRERALWATREAEEGFPVLNEQAVVDLWSSLEALLKNSVASFLQTDEGATKLEPVAKIRIRLGDYEVMSPRERYEYLVGELERELGTTFKQGVNRFEALLAPFGLSGPIDEETKKALFELSNVRHVIVHRRGLADRKFADACPWMRLAPSDEVKVTSRQYERYILAAVKYSTILRERLIAYFTSTRSSEKAAP
jgi:hypothetical protein